MLQAIYIQLSELINQLNIGNYTRILELIKNPNIDVNELNTVNKINNDLCYVGNIRAFVSDVSADFRYIVKIALNSDDLPQINKLQNNLTMLEAVNEASDESKIEEIYHKKMIETAQKLFLYHSSDWAISYMPSLYLFISDPNVPDAYELAHQLGLDGFTYEICNRS